MATLTVKPEGQVTFDKEILDHLGVQPGDQIKVDLLPGSQARLGTHESSESKPPTGRIEDFFGILAGKTHKVLTLEEIEEAISEGWAGRRR